MKKLRFITVFLLWIFVAGGLYGQIADLSAPIPPDPDITIGKLANGMTYYIKQNKKPEKRIEFRLVVNAGSICETDAQQGLAHFCEHMCFNGTKNFPGNSLIDTLEEMGVKFGADVNASTSFDQTIYQFQVPSDKPHLVEEGFRILEDWAHQVTFDAGEIDKERGVIIEEWRQGLGADDRMMNKYMPVLFKGSRYAERIPIGKVDILKSFPYDTLRKFYKTWYRPDLMAVIIVGDIDPRVAEAKVKQHFAWIPEPAHPEKRVEYPVPGNKKPLISIVTDKEASGYDVQVMYKQPRTEDITYNDYRNMLISSLFTDMLNNRFAEITRRPDAPFVYAGSGYGSFIGRTLDVYSLYASAKENQIDKSLETILRENERVCRYGFTVTEMEREKKDMLTYYENVANEANKTESATYADEFIRNYLTHECIPGYKKEYQLVGEMLSGITLEEINALGTKWTSGDNQLVLITGQEKAGVKIPDEQEVIDIINRVKSEDVTAYVDKVTDAPLVSVPPVASPVVKRSYNSEFGITELVFGNGVHMVLKPTDFKNDEILMTAFSPGGTSLSPDKDIMSAMLAATLTIQSGLGQFDYISLQKKLTGITANVTPYINELREGVNGSCTPKDLETMLQLNYLYFTATRKDKEAFDSYMSRLKNAIEPMRAVPQVIYSDTLSKIITMNSPRVVSLPTEAQLNQINLDTASAIFKDRFADAGDFTFIMAGNFKVDSIIPLLEKYIGGLPSTGRKETWKDVSPGFPAGKVIVDVPKNSEPQSKVTMVWEGDFKWKERDRTAFGMLMNILAITCRESMREDQGGVYGVSINGSISKYPESKFTISSTWGCSPSNIDTLSRTVLDEMNKIRLNGPEAVDLEKVKEELIRNRETKMEQNAFWLALLQSHYMYNDKLLTLDEYKKYINSFTIKDLKNVADKYLNTNKYVRVALTPAKAG